MFTIGQTVGLAEWIIDDTCPCYSCSYKKKKRNIQVRQNYFAK